MRLLAPLALLLLATPVAAQDHWGPASHFPVPTGYQTVGTGQGWGYTVDLVPETGLSGPLSALRLVFLEGEHTPDALAQQVWSAESPALGAAGWELAGPSETLTQMIGSGPGSEETEEPAEKECIGQLIRLRHTQDPQRQAQVQLFAWQEKNGSFGVLRSFAEGAEAEAIVAEALDGLHTWGISASSRRQVEVEDLRLRIPVSAQHELKPMASGEQLFRIGTLDGVIEIVLGTPGADAVASSAMVLERMHARFTELEKQGLGKRGESYTTFLERGDRLIPMQVSKWTPADQSELQFASAVLRVGDRRLAVQAQPQPLRSQALRELFEELVRFGIQPSAGKPRPSFAALRLRDCVTPLARDLRPQPRDIGPVPGMELTVPDLSFRMWLGLVPCPDEAALQATMDEVYAAHLAARGLDPESTVWNRGTAEILVEDESFAFAEPVPVEVPTAWYLRQHEHAPRTHSVAAVTVGRGQLLVAIGEAHPRERRAVEALLRSHLGRARRLGFGADEVMGLGNGNFPLAFPVGAWRCWSRESEGGWAELEAFHATGRVRMSASPLSEKAAAEFQPAEQSSSQARADRYASTLRSEDPTPVMRANRLFGGRLMPWRGFETDYAGRHERHAYTVWAEDGRRLLLEVHYESADGSLADAPFHAAWDACALHGVANAAQPEAVPRAPLGFGGLWAAVPREFEIEDRDVFPSGFTIGITGPHGPGWDLSIHTFLADEALSDAEVLERLATKAPGPEWDEENPPQTEDTTLDWLGVSAPARLTRGIYKDGRPGSLLHAVHRQGRVCRSWSLRADSLAGDNARRLLDVLRVSFQVEGDLRETIAGETRGQPAMIGDTPWPMVKSFGDGDPVEQGGSSYFRATDLATLIHVPFPVRLDRIEGFLDSFGLIGAENPPSVAELRETCATGVFTLHGRLHSFLTLKQAEGATAAAIVPFGEVDHLLVMTLLEGDPLPLLLRALHHWPEGPVAAEE